MNVRLENGRLMIGGEPFLMLAGEVHNSAVSTRQQIRQVFSLIKGLNANSVLAPVSWELLEPREGAFDFSLVDEMIAEARRLGLRLGLLWFGSYKNGCSSYAPGWVKNDVKRFPRMQVKRGQDQVRLDFLGDQRYQALSPFSKEALRADSRAFAALMAHLKEVDAEASTVLMVQVENEVGLLGSARDRSQAADQAFARPVPDSLVQALSAARGQLLEPLASAFQGGAGSWEQVFGSMAEEAFMAWHLGRYVGQVAEAGRREHAIPLSVNAWLPMPEGQPGRYPSGGPSVQLMEIWRCAAPVIDLYAPDIYLPEFRKVCGQYHRAGNSLIIPETALRADACANAIYAVGRHHALCFAPFGLEDLALERQPEFPVGGPMNRIAVDKTLFQETYQMLDRLVPLLCARYGTKELRGIHGQEGGAQLDFAPYRVDVAFPEGETGGACLALRLGEEEFLLAGLGFKAEVRSMDPERPHCDYLSIEEGQWIAGRWNMTRRRNGDEYSISASRPGMLRVRVYRF